MKAAAPAQTGIHQQDVDRENCPKAESPSTRPAARNSQPIGLSGRRAAMRTPEDRHADVRCDVEASKQAPPAYALRHRAISPLSMRNRASAPTSSAIETIPTDQATHRAGDGHQSTSASIRPSGRPSSGSVRRARVVPPPSTSRGSDGRSNSDGPALKRQPVGQHLADAVHSNLLDSPPRCWVIDCFGRGWHRRWSRGDDHEAGAYLDKPTPKEDRYPVGNAKRRPGSAAREVTGSLLHLPILQA